jgi:hypothetical protein
VSTSIGDDRTPMKTVEGYELEERELALLAPAEQAVFAARPMFATVGLGDHWGSSLLLLSDRRLVLSRARIVRRPRVDFAVEWSAVTTVQGELWNGGGPMIRLMVQTSRHGVELIVDPQYAVDVESAIRSGYLD